MMIVNLNIRDLGGGTKTRYLRQLITSEGVEFVSTRNENNGVLRCQMLCFVGGQ